jgi:hypothetical protein
MNARIARGLAAAVGALAVAGAALVAAPVASANGTLSITPAAGTGETAMAVTTTGGCASPNATHYVVTLSGTGVTGDITLNGLQPLSAIPALGSQTTPMSVPVASNLDMAQAAYSYDQAGDDTSVKIPTGVYSVKFVCRAGGDPKPITVYEGSLTLRQTAAGIVFEEGSKSITVTNTAKPKISGQGKVGATLKATTGTWDPAPDATTFTWKVGKETVGTGPSYKVKAGDRGKTISVTVTATKDGYNPGKASATIKIAR